MPTQLADHSPGLYPKQLLFYNTVVTNLRAHRHIIHGGVQSGKTEVVSEIAKGKIGEKMSRTCSGEKPGTAWFVAPTYKLLGKLKRCFVSKLPIEWIEKLTDEEIILITGDLIQFRSAKNPQDLRGEDCFLVVFDELSRAAEDAFLNCQSRLAFHEGLFIGATTPCNAESPWLTDEYFAHLEDPEYTWTHCSIEDNLDMPRSRIAELRKRFPDEYGIEELDGHFLRSREGLVYKNFDGRLHIIEDGDTEEGRWKPADDDVIVAGADQGLNHPFVYIRVALHPGGGMTVFDEIVLKQTAPSDQVAAVMRDPIEKRVARRWFDPSGALTRAEFLKNGLLTRAAKNEVDDGIRSVYSHLANPGSFHITRNCAHTIKEFGLYRYQKNTPTSVGAKPYKINDDAMDCVRYVCHSERLNIGIISATSRTDIEKDLKKKNEQKMFTKFEPGRGLVCVVNTPTYMKSKDKKLKSQASWWN